jgi:hypothetical protein
MGENEVRAGDVIDIFRLATRRLSALPLVLDHNLYNGRRGGWFRADRHFGQD